MATVDSYPLNHTSLLWLLFNKQQRQHTSQVLSGKNNNFHSIYLLHLLHDIRPIFDPALRDSSGLCSLSCKFLFV